jgi:hypothetical protein
MVRISASFPASPAFDASVLVDPLSVPVICGTPEDTPGLEDSSAPEIAASARTAASHFGLIFGYVTVNCW